MQKHSWRLTILFFLVLLPGTAPLFSFYPKDFTRPLTTIAFGSCNRQDLPQPLWGVILEAEPDLWIWGGDNIYGDSPDAKVLKSKYDLQFNQAGYQLFRERIAIIGTWDDHDYGENNSGKWFQSKESSQKLALDFLEEPNESPRRARQGIYAAYTFGPAGKRVKILLLDVRYHADLPGPEGDLLGDRQWQWLETELANSQARVNLIVSGIQFLHEEHRYEKWANFPRSRSRLLNFVKSNNIPGVIILSGDRHIHELAMKDDDETPYPLIEMTSSGLTHPWTSFGGEPNQYRVGDVFHEKGYGILRFDWEAREPRIHLQIRNGNNGIEQALNVRVNQLHPDK